MKRFCYVWGGFDSASVTGDSVRGLGFKNRIENYLGMMSQV